MESAGNERERTKNRLLQDWKDFSKNPYRKLLLVLILLFITSALVSGTTFGFVTMAFLLFCVSFLLAQAFMRTRKTFLTYVSFAFLTSLLDCVTVLELFGKWTATVTVLCISSYAVLLIVAIAVIAAKISGEHKVSLDVILGGICIYIQLGFLWYLCYMAVAVSDPSAFQSLSNIRHYDLAYFSFSTLTTLGNGDIVPISRLARVLCNLEAIVGQMFPSIFIARLVGLYVVDEMESRRQRREGKDSR